jgi:hypothetical protein
MRWPVKHIVWSAIAALSCLSAAHAQEGQVYECRQGDDVRSVAVTYSGDGAKGCSVLYKKAAASGEPAKQLWHYQAHPEMCAGQAQQFLKKLEGLGLACSAARR